MLMPISNKPKYILQNKNKKVNLHNLNTKHLKSKKSPKLILWPVK